MRVLVTEPLSERGLDLLRKDFEVDVREDLASGPLADEIAPYDALVVRSQTQVRADVLDAARNLKVVARAGIGLDIAAEHPERAWAVTQVAAPEGIDGTELVANVRRDHGLILAPGQGPLKGKVFRIGHLGQYDRLDILRGLAAIEMTLADMGYPVQPGAAVAAAEAVFQKG